MKNEILIQKKYLIFREEAKKLVLKIKKTNQKKVFLNFSKVIFMSRSFVDELLNQLKDSKKEVIFKELKPSLSEFISKIKKTKSQIQKIFSQK